MNFVCAVFTLAFGDHWRVIVVVNQSGFFLIIDATNARSLIKKCFKIRRQCTPFTFFLDTSFSWISHDWRVNTINFANVGDPCLAWEKKSDF